MSLKEQLACGQDVFVVVDDKDGIGISAHWVSQNDSFITVRYRTLNVRKRTLLSGV